ncbi:MAG: ketoacyl-ACP synthase III [Candidatus Paracaedimonas acanthamoebae]|uniref:Beta-ketoacyl-[acyl-carrier-protein] synthase III n=1 Tax=Candidatus Paracaedimonas acanthamoebae TaxID=244581 RepID=A0A8J7PRX2_9PROT|nr:ketoacyl-ACP synthase III [Candidatus Paracaedimonas acanthamoebae]
MIHPTQWRSVITGVGGYLPQRVVTNYDLSEVVDTSHEWIVERTGIHQRHFAAENEFTSHLCAKAAECALKNAGKDINEIDLIIVATASPDLTFPSTAALTQKLLKNTNALAFDVAGVCAGFLLALQVADNFLRLRQAKTALVIGGETFSRLIDMEDRRTNVLFGDGAGAIVLESMPPEKAGERGVLGVHLQTDGQFSDILYTDGGASSSGKTGKIRMSGQEVYKHAVTKLTDSAIKILTEYNITVNEIDWFIPHQANARIIESVAQRLNLPLEKVIVTVDRHANTSAASIPLALWTATQEGRVKPGDLILHEGIGGGLIWGSALVRY